MNDSLSGTPSVRPADHPPVASGRIGVLIVNLGTPDGTDYWSMRRYLKEFLSDRRVIETNRLVWWLVLNLIILTIRPGRKGRDYDEDLESRARRIAAENHHARAGRKAQHDAGGGGCAAHRRLGDALRQSLDCLAARRACSAQAASAS